MLPESRSSIHRAARFPIAGLGPGATVRASFRKRSAGADRFTLAVLCEALAEDEIGGEKRTVMRFHPRLAPIKAAVLPLVNKDGMPEKAEALYRALKKHFNVFYDDKGAVGRRYRRQDEAGTPFCFTIDGQTMQDDTVTIRERDSTQQRRIPIGQVETEIRTALM